MESDVVKAGVPRVWSGPRERPILSTVEVRAAGASAGARARSERLRVAVIGAGYIADHHLAVLRGIEGVEVVIVVDPDEARARAAASRHGVARTASSIEALRDERIDVAHLLVPPDVHVSMAKALLEMGIGAFVEKPLALSGAEARSLAAQFQERGLPLGANHNNLFHPAFARLLARVRAGEIGRVEHVQATLSVPLAQLESGDFAHWMFRAPRNIVFEQAVHPLCQVHALAGRVVDVRTTLLSTRELAPGQPFVDRWSVSGRGERATMQLYLAFGQGFTRSTIQVLGTDGSLEADLFHDALSGERKTVHLDFWNSFLATRGRGKALVGDAWRTLRRWIGHTLGVSRREDAFFAGMRGSIEAFYSALRNGAALRSGAPLPVDGNSAAEVLDWCDAIASAAPPAPPMPPPFPAPGPARAREVVVLGATGFIGKRTVAKLLEASLPVTIVARRAHALPPEIASAIREGRVRFFTGSLEDPATAARAFEGAHSVIHLATGNGDTWEKVQRSMVDGSRAIAQAALEKGVKRFVYASSIAALYTGPDAPQPIADATPCDPRPESRSIYARGKIAAEAALQELCATKRLPLVIVRPGVVMGAGSPPTHSGLGLWQRDNHCIGWGHGDHPLPIVWVDDVADALVAVVDRREDDLHGKALNLCARTELTAKQMVAEIGRVTGRTVHFHPRSLATSQAMEIGKYAVKKAGRRPGVDWPSWRDLKSRALAPRFSSDLAREKLGWKPVEDAQALLARCLDGTARPPRA
jgi:predicted dehydrogenase/nucleoside-diphosphate-sugar epimerase